MRHRFHPTVLRAYDMRGVIGETLHLADAYAVGIGFGMMVREAGGGRVAVGRDGRLSSPEMAAALKEGLMAAGISIADIGLAPTPLLYFADRHLDTDAAIQVTGSHNPPGHNGFKMVFNHAPFFGDDIQRLGAMLAAGIDTDTGIGTGGGGGGSVEEVGLSAAYLDAITAAAGDLVQLADENIIWDCGNGATGPLTERLTARLPGRHDVLFAAVDGRFPNHHPDPAALETLALLQDAMKAAGASLGIGFDGDGDRIGILDHQSRQVPGDVLTAYLARGVLARHPGSQVIFDIKASQTALEAVRREGGKPCLWKSGHSHMKMRLAATAAPLGGEMSGHIFIADGYFGFDDAIFAALAVLREWLRCGETLGDFTSTLPPAYATPEVRIACADGDKFNIVARVAAAVAATPDSDQHDITALDGVRVSGAAGWWLIRASNTSAEIVVRAEGYDAAARDDLIGRVRGRLADAGLIWDGSCDGIFTDET